MGSIRPCPKHANHARAARAAVVAPGQGGPHRAERSDDGQARGPAWRRTSSGLYVPVSVDGAVPEQRIVEAAAVLPASAASPAGRFAGPEESGSTARRSTVSVASRDLATGYSDVRSQAGIVISQERLRPGEIEELDGLRSRRWSAPSASRCDTPATARGCRPARHGGVLRSGRIEEAAIYALAHPGWTGIPQCRDALSLADENSWSPWESRLRIVWVVDARLSEAVDELPGLRPDGCHLGTPDLLDEEAGRGHRVRRCPSSGARPASARPGPRAGVPGCRARVPHDHAR